MLGKTDGGQTTIEYALIIAGVSLFMVGLMIGFGGGLLTDASAVIDGWFS